VSPDTNPGPASYRRQLGFTLRDRLLALNLGTVLVLVLLSLLVVDMFARQQIRASVAQDLIRTGTVFTRLMQDRAQSLRTQSLVVADDPRFSATLDVPDPDLDAHARTVGSEAKHFQGILRSDLFIVTNRDGTVLSRLESLRPDRVVEQVQTDGLQRWRVGDVQLQVVVAPVMAQTGPTSESLGQLAVGFTSTFDPAPVRELLQDLAAQPDLGKRLQTELADGILWDLQLAFTPGVAAVLSADGSVVDLLLCHTSYGQDLHDEPVIALALTGRGSVGLRTEAGRLFQTAIVPVWSPDGLVGSLLTGFLIDDDLAADLRSMTRSHVSFFTDGGQLVASTWGPTARSGLQLPDRRDEPFESELGDETFLTLSGGFGSEDGAAGTFVIQRSLDEAYSFLYILEELLLLVALVVIILAAGASFIGARRLSRPVEALVDGTRILGAGDLDHRIQVSSRSELGELATSFNEMASDMQRSRQTLVESEKLRALGEMAAGVAHNFNNLLTVVVGNAELINLREDIPEEIRQETTGILDSARRCSAIVRRIQTFGRPIDLDVRHMVDLSDLCREVVELTRPKWKAEPERDGRRIRIDTNLATVPEIHTQGSAWEEMLSNLIFNAVDAMPDGGLITLTTHVAEGHVVVGVRDTGTGMDQTTQQRIFEPFYTTKGQESGTGLGLSTVWGLIQQLGGRIDVKSEPGEGTLFRLWAPLDADTPTETAKPAASRKPPPEVLDILVVDDEAQVLELIPALLEGHRVTAVRGGSRGLALASQQDFDVVLSDWVMDEASGLEIAAAARQRDENVVIVLMTGWAFDADTVQGGQCVDQVLPKPFERDGVIEQVRSAQELLHTRRGGPPLASS
jgi:signal transduction histidine kinase/ActR/RegA family two-component response regulator